MGQLIYLSGRGRGRARPPAPSPPVFFFDVACPLSYLTAECVERRLGVVDWVPVDGAVLRARSPHAGDGQSFRRQAAAYARALRLPLVWPARFPAGARCAARACTFACEVGAGAAFALAASRLAFCGGFDPEDPETLAEAAAAGGVPWQECLAAAGQAGRDAQLDETLRGLRFHGVTELPAIAFGALWCQGAAGLTRVAALDQPPPQPRRWPLVPAS